MLLVFAKEELIGHSGDVIANYDSSCEGGMEPGESR
jgi:hypothetical protein